MSSIPHHSREYLASLDLDKLPPDRLDDAIEEAHGSGLWTRPPVAGEKGAVVLVHCAGTRWRRYLSAADATQMHGDQVLT